MALLNMLGLRHTTLQQKPIRFEPQDWMLETPSATMFTTLECHPSVCLSWPKFSIMTFLDLTWLNCKIQSQNQHQSTTVRGMPHIHICSCHHINTYTIHKLEHIPPGYIYPLLLTLCSQHIFEVCDKICGEHILLLYQLRVYQPTGDFIKAIHIPIYSLCVA